MSYDSKDENDKNEVNSPITKEIKKYIFNSNKANTIYCICINGV